jgi:hypothetical protein
MDERELRSRGETSGKRRFPGTAATNDQNPLSVDSAATSRR